MHTYVLDIFVIHLLLASFSVNVYVCPDLQEVSDNIWLFGYFAS